MKYLYLLLTIAMISGCTIHTSSHVCTSSCQHRVVYVGTPMYPPAVISTSAYVNTAAPFVAYQQTYNCVQLNAVTTRCYTNAPDTNGNFGWQ